MGEQRIGDLEPTGRGTEVRVVAPTHCRNGDPLGPQQVEVRWLACRCDGAVTGGHLSWFCVACSDVQIAADHNDDALLGEVPPAPSAQDAKAARRREVDGPNTGARG